MTGMVTTGPRKMWSCLSRRVFSREATQTASISRQSLALHRLKYCASRIRPLGVDCNNVRESRHWNCRMVHQIVNLIQCCGICYLTYRCSKTHQSLYNSHLQCAPLLRSTCKLMSTVHVTLHSSLQFRLFQKLYTAENRQQGLFTSSSWPVAPSSSSTYLRVLSGGPASIQASTQCPGVAIRR